MLLTYTHQRQKKKIEEKLREECMEETLMVVLLLPCKHDSLTWPLGNFE